MIEMLVVIGLIALLGTMLLIGINHLITNSKKAQTRLAFQNAQGLYSEWDAVHRQHWSSEGFPCPTTLSGSAAELMTRGIISQLKAMPVNAAALGKIELVR